jgi:hypothetical protein
MISLSKIIKGFDGYIIYDKPIPLFSETQLPCSVNPMLAYLSYKPLIYVADSYPMDSFSIVQKADVYALCIPIELIDTFSFSKMLNPPTMLIAYGKPLDVIKTTKRINGIKYIAVVEANVKYYDDINAFVCHMSSLGCHLVIVVNGSIKQLSYIIYKNTNVLFYENL